MVERYLRHRAGKQPIQPGDRAALKRLLSVLRDAGTIAPGGARQQRATADSLCRRYNGRTATLGLVIGQPANTAHQPPFRRSAAVA